MSRVFETLTAAVYEKKNPAKRELRHSAAEDDLIARFRLTLRNERVSTEAVSLLGYRITQETEEAKISDCHEIAVHEDECDSGSRPYFHYIQGAPVAALLAAVTLIMGYLAMPAHYGHQKQVNNTNTDSERQQSVPATQISEDTKTRSDEQELSIAAGPEGSQVPAKLDSAAWSLLTKPPNKTWSVQVSAITSKKIAAKVMQDLKSEGYDVYLVRAEVEGQLYYRVRIGRFTMREEAEPVRRSLSRHEAYRDAYLAAD